MKRKAEGIALLSLYNDEDDDDLEEEEEAKLQEAPDENKRNVLLGGMEFEAKNFERTQEVAVAGTQEEVAVAIDNNENLPTKTDAEICAQPRVEENLSTLANSQSMEQILSEFLPPPPTEKCSDELQMKIARYVALKEAGRSFNEELRNSKGYRNPDFLQHAVLYQGVDQIGSCFKKEVFDPHGYPPEDFYQAIAAEQSREHARREQERKQSQKVEFRPPMFADFSMMQRAGLTNQVATLISAPLSSASAAKTEVRARKSKWDKVDGDVKFPQDAVAAATAQATLAAVASAQAIQQKKAKEDIKGKPEKVQKGKTDRNRS